MSISIIQRVCNPTRKLEPIRLPCLSLSTIASPPSDQHQATADPLISDAVSVLTHHRSKSRWSTLRSLLHSGITAEQFSEITLRIRNNPHLALRFFIFTRRHFLCLQDVVSCCTLVHVLARSRLKRHAQDIMRLAIQLARDDLDGTSHETESKCLLRVFRSLVKTYNRCGSAPFVFDLLIKSCLDSKKIDGSILIMRKLKRRGINPQISTCNALISEVSRRRGAYVGYELYIEIFGLDVDIEEPVKWNVRVKPNSQTFNALMVCFYREGEMEKVEEIWKEMEELGCSPNAYSYTILMAVYCERGLVIEAEKLWEEMKVKGLDYDVVTYNTIIGGFCKIGEIEKAEKAFLEMELKGKEHTCVTYEHLINGYSKFGDSDSATLVFNDMCRKGFRPENSTVEALVKGLCNKGRFFEAMKVMRVAMRDLGFCPNSKSYEMRIKGLCEEGKMDEALKIQAEMVGRGFGPNLEIYKAFIDGYMKVGNQAMAVSLRREMVECLKSQEFDKGLDLNI